MQEPLDICLPSGYLVIVTAEPISILWVLFSSSFSQECPQVQFYLSQSTLERARVHSAPFSRLSRKLCHHDPEQRFPHAQRACSILRSLIHPSPVHQAPPTKISSQRSKRYVKSRIAHNRPPAPAPRTTVQVLEQSCPSRPTSPPSPHLPSSKNPLSIRSFPPILLP